MKFKKYVYLTTLLIILPLSLSAQTIRELLEKVKIEYTNKNYYTTLNRCREILKICNENPEPECWFTNVMKNVYRYKGLTEFEIYKKELKAKRLTSSILSLKKSYNLYRDPEILYMYGYLLSIEAILLKNTSDFLY